MKIGILGGTFDPIHKAHIAIAKAALNQFELDKVVIMPTPNPPHKEKERITSNFHRANMIRLAIKELDKIEFSDFELNRKDITYTADTLSMLKELHPENSYYFIVGSDSISSFNSWYRPDVILKNATLLAVRRDDRSSAVMDSDIARIEAKYGANVGIISMDKMHDSSSYIRTHSYKEIKDMVTEPVYHYIVENNLYQNCNVNTAWSVNKIIEDLEKKLKPARFQHTLGVAQTAKEMAEIFGVNPNKAYLAGILHDCAKNFTDEQLLHICAENNVHISDIEKNSPYLLHGKAGAIIAKSKYNIEDQEVLSAVVWHTTGKEQMSDLEKIIFSADYIEPGRNKQPNLEYLRRISKTDLNLLVYNILKDTVDYLQKSGKDSIDANTINAYRYYRKLIEEK